MTLSRLLCIVISLLCVACSPEHVIYKPSDTEDRPNGEVKPLSDLLHGSSGVRLIFVHGVGDHCPGYALDPKNGWLNKDNAKAMGLTPVSDKELDPKLIDVNVYMQSVKGRQSGVWYSQKDYRLKLSDREEIPVEAIEITWSPLTQWIKTDLLGYDSPSAFTDPDRPECLKAPTKGDKATVQAPWRVRINKQLKEEVFDRNLADAMLYAGTYRKTMEQGLAEGVCHAVTQTPKEARCIWPSPSERDGKGYKNVFVTHSLGSRMIYDMFLDLTSTAETNAIFPKDARDKARPFIERMLQDTPAFYMMANQLVLLGLANVPPDVGSNGAISRPFRYITPLTKLTDGDEASARSSRSLKSTESVSAGVPDSTSESDTFGNVLLKIGVLKAQIAEKTRQPVAGLEIISFNDTNDLLTWHIPSPYVSKDGDAFKQSVPVNVTDVFVHNAWRLLYLFENPSGAHVNYFKNPVVRDIIRCGGNGREIFRCAD